MAASILVVGLRGEDSGKTMVALAVLQCLSDQGVVACGFKPKAGNNLWFDYDVVYEALSQGRLYGKDAKLLRRYSSVDLAEEVVNPVHRLWVKEPTWQYAHTLPYFLVDRATLSEDGSDFLVVVNKRALSEFRDCEELLLKLCGRAKEVIEVRELVELNSLAETYDKLISIAYNKVKRSCEVMVVESYSDVALPWDGLENLKAVFGIEPWSIKLYDPDKYLTTVRLSSQLRRVDEVTTKQVQRLLKPLKEIRVLPSTSENIVKDLKIKVKPILNELKLVES